MKPRGAQAASVTAREGRRAFRELERALEPLRPTLAKVHPALGDLGPVVVLGAVAAAVLALVLLVFSATGGASARGMAYEKAVKEILDGDARDVVEDLEGVPAAQRTLAQDLALGDAYAAILDDERALEAYESPIYAGVVDGLALGFLLSRLDASAPDDEMDMLVLWPDSDVEDLLADMTLDPRRFVRQNATAVLVERGALGRIPVEGVALLDVQDGPCGVRRAALLVLRTAGRTKAALDVVDRVGRTSEQCFGNDLRVTFQSIQRRLPQD
jgi:hypothetical protein